MAASQQTAYSSHESVVSLRAQTRNLAPQLSGADSPAHKQERRRGLGILPDFVLSLLRRCTIADRRSPRRCACLSLQNFKHPAAG